MNSFAFPSAPMVPLMPFAPSNREKFDAKIMFTLQPSLQRKLDAFVEHHYPDRSAAIRDAIELLMNPRRSVTEDAGLNQFRAPLFGAIPGGPWEASQAEDEAFVISEDTADFLEARPEDGWFPIEGDSMACAGLPDGSLALARPYKGKAPKRHDIVSVAIIVEGHDEPLKTVKRFDGMDGEVPRLVDGQGQEFSYPEGMLEVHIVSRVVGSMARIA